MHNLNSESIINGISRHKIGRAVSNMDFVTNNLYLQSYFVTKPIIYLNLKHNIECE